MLHLKKVLGAKPKEHEQVQMAELLTPWGEAIDADHVLEEHPDPQFARTSYESLNGTWECAFVNSGHAATDDLLSVVKQAPLPHGDAFAMRILVPFSPEALLSGVGRQLKPDELLWYRRRFALAAVRGNSRVLLHFQAVDYACAVRVNGMLAGAHAGGYTPFALDVTDLVNDGENELAVCVADPSEFGGRLRGKQRFDRGDIWYTAQSGIWQSVWIEIVPEAYIKSFELTADLDAARVRALLRFSTGTEASEQRRAALELLDADGRVVASASCNTAESSCVLEAPVQDVHPWSPDEPYLYGIRLAYGQDEVSSYCGFRTVEVRKCPRGRARVFLNGKPLFIKGVLDQAYWSDGLMTAPADAALEYDIRCMKQAGFNLMRKHIKIESARWYYHCDRLGMLVLQDMVSGGDPEIKTWHWSYKPTLFRSSWTRYSDAKPAHQANLGAGDAGYRREWTLTCCETVRLLTNHPSIIGWSLFNEGWGQFDAAQAFDMVRKLDPSRFVDATSGWFDQACGDFFSVHNYFRDMKVWRDRQRGRAFFISEFGGYTHRVEGHSALDEAYGYELYDALPVWQDAVRTLLANMDAMEDQGLAGYVFTQVSDIEEETNGILTYDRRINKLAAQPDLDPLP